MYRNDKIVKKGELKAEEVVNLNHAFYLFLVPKSDASNSVAILDVQLCDEDTFSECPFVPNEWNPVSVSKLRLTSTILSNYRVFWGGE